MNIFDLYRLFDFSSKEAMIQESATSIKLLSIMGIHSIFLDRPNISLPIMFLSSKTSGIDNMNIENIISYLYNNIEERNLLDLTKELFLIKKVFKDKEDSIDDDIYKILDFQTKEEMNESLDSISIELAIILLIFPEISLSLKIFSEITTKIEFNEVIDYINYINKVMTNEEKSDFFKILNIKD